MLLHTLVDRERKRCKNADEGVILVAIQIAVDSDLSAEQRRLRVQHTYSPARGEEKLRESSGSTTAWWWSLQFSGRAPPSTTEEEVLGRERAAPGEGVRLPCASPLSIGVEGAGYLSSKSIGALAKVGERNPIISFPHRLLSPLFRDLDLIPSGYDLIGAP